VTGRDRVSDQGIFPPDDPDHVSGAVASFMANHVCWSQQ
jgi:hypothetical protein